MKRAYLGTAVALADGTDVKFSRFLACVMLTTMQSVALDMTAVVLCNVLLPDGADFGQSSVLTLVILECAVFVVNWRLFSQFAIDDVLIDQYLHLRRVRRSLRCYGAMHYGLLMIWTLTLAYVYMTQSQ